MLFVFLFLRRSLSLFRLAMPHWLNMSMSIGSETIIANGALSRISVVFFPSMETLQPEWFSDQPDIARSQIEILVTNKTDEFDTIYDNESGQAPRIRTTYHKSAHDLKDLTAALVGVACTVLCLFIFLTHLSSQLYDAPQILDYRCIDLRLLQHATRNR
jgi:hypothetical protein